MLAAGWINLNLASFSRYTTCSQWKSATRKVATFSGEVGWCWNVGCPVGRMTLDVVKMPNSCCPAAECDTVNQWKCKDSWDIKRVFNNSLLVTYGGFCWAKGKLLKLPKVAFLGMTMIYYDSGCWMIVVCWDAIPAFWFFLLVICKGMLFYFKELPKSQTCLDTIRDELQWCETTLFQIEVAILRVKRLQPFFSGKSLHKPTWSQLWVPVFFE